MTEQEWLRITDPDDLMRKTIRTKGLGNDRQFRLMGIACCRRIWHLLDEKLRNAIELAENYLENIATAAEMDACLDSLQGRYPYGSTVRLCCYPTHRIKALSVDAVCTARAAAVNDLLKQEAGKDVPTDRSRVMTLYKEEKEQQMVLFRDIFGNPFQPIQLERTRLTPTIMAIAQTNYSEHQFEGMPILADALEEAGCTNEDILDHCRNNQEHARGCWVLDLLLEKK